MPYEYELVLKELALVSLSVFALKKLGYKEKFLRVRASQNLAGLMY